MKQRAQTVEFDGVSFSVDEFGVLDCTGLALNGQRWADSRQLSIGVRDRSGGVFVAKELRYDEHSVTPTETGRTLRIVASPNFSAANGPHKIRVVLEYQSLNDGLVLEETIALENTGGRTLFCSDAKLGWSTDAKVEYFLVPFDAANESPRAVDPRSQQYLRRSKDGLLLLKQGHVLTVSPGRGDMEPQRVGIARERTRVSFGMIEPLHASVRTTGFTPGTTLLLSSTRFRSSRGGIEEGLKAHRSYMQLRGVGVPKNYNPPLNYCQYYECGGHWTFEQAVRCADIAQDLGCELLYLDQGWEDSFGSGLWDDKRLGPQAQLISACKERNLRIGALVGLHNKAEVFPLEYYRRSGVGTIEEGDTHGHPYGVCPSVRDWQKEKTERLVRLIDEGISFLSFDFNDYHLSCCCRQHDHSVPMERWEHVRAVAEQQSMVKRLRPHVLQEAHDWVDAGACVEVLYLFQDGHDERWGFEYMWEPMADLRSGRIHNLYYYNMSYGLPLYLHIDCSFDNQHLVVFWYMASVIRHLGIGNATSLNKAQYERLKESISTYKRLRPWLVHGEFDGTDRNVHIHRLASRGAVVLVFNDSEEKAIRSVQPSRALLGIPDGVRITRHVEYGPAPLASGPDPNLDTDFSLEPLSVSVLLFEPASR